MARFDRNDMAANPLSEKREVADNIDDFVAHEFVGKPQWLLAQDRFAAHDDRVLEAAAFNEVFFHERLDVFVVNKRPGWRDLPLVNGGGDFRGKKLCELAVGT